MEKFTYFRVASGIKEENVEASIQIAELGEILGDEGRSTVFLKYLHLHGYSHEKAAFIAYKLFMNSNPWETGCPNPKIPFQVRVVKPKIIQKPQPVQI